MNIKITAEQADEIREAYLSEENGAGVQSLAGRYRVSTDLVYRVLKGEHPHTRGMPNIAGRRRRGLRGSFKPLSPPAANPVARINRLIPGSPMTQKQQRKLKWCPTCGANPHEACYSKSSVGIKPIASLHPARV